MDSVKNTRNFLNACKTTFFQMTEFQCTEKERKKHTFFVRYSRPYQITKRASIFKYYQFSKIPNLIKIICNHGFFRIFVIQILHEINFRESKSPKTAIFGALNFVNFVNFRLQKVQKLMKIKIQCL